MVAPAAGSSTKAVRRGGPRIGPPPRASAPERRIGSPSTHWLRLFALAAALIYIVLLGGTDAGKDTTAVRAVNALLGAGAVVLWIGAARRGADIVDGAVTVALLAFLVSCLTSRFPRESLDAATSALAYAAAFGVARRELRHPRAREMLGGALAVAALLLAAAFAVTWGGVWLRWLSLSGFASLPPLDLVLPVGVHRHYYAVAILLALLVPALATWLGRPALRYWAAAGLAVCGGLIAMSGSRSVWLALAGTGVALALLGRGRVARRVALITAIVGALAAAAWLLGVADPVVRRLLAAETVAGRVVIWSETIEAWLLSPLVGLGPGSFGNGISMVGFFDRMELVGRHADNALIQLLAEGGLVASLPVTLAAGGVLALAIGGLRRRRPAGLAPVATLLIFALVSLTNNPSDYANSAIVVVVAAAWAVPLGAGGGRLGRAGSSAWIPRLSAVAGLVVAGTVAATLLAAAAHDAARAHAAAGREREAVGALRTALAFDPTLALYRRELGARLLALGHAEPAARLFAEAAALNPADPTAWRSLALAHSRADRHAAAIEAAATAVRRKAADPANGLTLAYVADRAGADGLARDALVDVLAVEPWLAAAPSWPMSFPAGGELHGLLGEAAARWAAGQGPARRVSLAPAWLGALAGDEELVRRAATETPLVASSGVALAAAVDCRIAEAARALDAADPAERATADYATTRIIVGRLADTPDLEAFIALRQLRYPALAWLTGGPLGGASPTSGPAEDYRLYERRVLADAPGLRFPTSEEGLGAWLQRPVEAVHASTGTACGPAGT